MADEKDQLRGEQLDKRAAELNIEGRSDMTADEKRQAVGDAESSPQGRTDEALAAERDDQDAGDQAGDGSIGDQGGGGQSSAQRSDQLAAADGTPEGQDPAPQQASYRPVGVVDTRQRVDAKDRNTFIGPIQRADRDADVSDEYLVLDDLGDDRREIDGEEVRDFQVIGGRPGVVIRINGTAYNFGELAGGLSTDLGQALLVAANS